VTKTKYHKACGIILRKQNYKETDQIITIWTREYGKMRLLARGLRKSVSKLAGNLQDLHMVEVEYTGKWPTLISAKVVDNFKGIRTNLAKFAPAYYACELLLKMTADEHPNTRAFDLLSDFLQELSRNQTEVQAYTMIDIYALDLAQALGFGRPEEIRSHFDVRNFIESLIERNIKSEPFLISI
jgi:DNA repair protein RecO